MIVVIGAGPAGLSLAYHLERDSVVIEREAEVGGLCRSFELEGCVFDLGGHAFFTPHQHVADLLARLCSGGLFRQQRSAWVYSHDEYVPYPFQSNLHCLPVDVVRECLVGAVDRVAAPLPVRASTLDQWIEQAFGAGVARHFLRPYNEKLWAHPLGDIVPSWTTDRVVQPAIADMIDGALRRRPYLATPNAEISYPHDGGYVELFRGFLPRVAPKLRRGTATRVDLDARIVATAEGDEYPYDELVSTMPLDELVRVSHPIPAPVRALASSLQHNSLVLVNLVIDRPAVTEMQRVYVADPRIPFHKVVMNSNASPRLRARPHFGIQAEVSYSRYKPLAADGLVDAIPDHLRGMGIIAATDRIVASSTLSVPYAYPIATPGSEATVSELRAYFLERGVHLLGRFGEWAYINSDEAVHRGIELARAMSGQLAEPTAER
jgi:protoporphyrinogen oxidase